MAVVKQPYGAADSGRGLAARTHAGICPHRTSLRRCAAAASLLALLAAPAGVADFVPGRVYVADAGVPPVFDGGPPDRIWEVNPDTGETRLFATIPEEFCGGFQSLAFTPDGRFLRGAALATSCILEIDGAGNVNVALDSQDGIRLPHGVGFDAQQRFHVANSQPPELVRFDADGGPPETVLGPSDGLATGISLAFEATGDVWAAHSVTSAPNLFRITGEGDVQAFHLSSLLPGSIVAHPSGDIYLQSVSLLNFGIFRLPQGDPGEMARINHDDPPFGTISLSASGDELYVAGPSEFARISLATGDVLGSFPLPGSTPGTGMAVYVPEPGVLLALALLGLGCVRPKRVPRPASRVGTFALAIFAAPAGLAEFVPGNVYVAAPRYQFCSNPDTQRDQIWEVNPESGQARTFATIPDEFCGVITGLAFTPDGRYPRASAFFGSRVLEIDGEGNVSEALGPADGIGAPQGSNNVGYDALGRFYIGNLSPLRVLRFDEDGLSEVVLSLDDGLQSTVSMVSDKEGGMWVAQGGGFEADWDLLRVTAEDDIESFYVSGLSISSIAINSSGTIFMLSGLGQLFTSSTESPEAVTPLSDPGLPSGSITLSPDERSLYVAGNGGFARVDPATGEVLESLVFPGTPYAGYGMAVYVPEPSGAAGCAVLLLSLRERRESRWRV